MIEETKDKMRQLRTYGMLKAYDQVLADPSLALTTDELVAHLVDWEWNDRRNRAITRLVKMAGFRYSAEMEELDYHPSRKLDRDIIQRLATGNYLGQCQNILISGPTGTGKSFLATALGRQACQLGYRVMYSNTARLFTWLKQIKSEGKIIKELQRIEKIQLLILDDFGLQPLDVGSRNLLLDVMEDRHGRGSTIIVGQIPLESWHSVIGDPTVADALMDRWVHGAYRIALSGESMRLKTTGRDTNRN